MKSVKLFLLLFLFLLKGFFSFAQPYDPEKVNKKAIALFNEAVAKFDDGKQGEAVNLLQQAIDKDNRYVDAWLLMARIHRDNNRYDDCINAYEKAFAIDQRYTFDFKLPYSVAFAGKGDFEKALRIVDTLLASDSLNPNTRKAALVRKNSYQFAVNYAKSGLNKNYVFAPQNIGPGINSTESEYFPSLTIDNKELVFTRRLKNYNEDFYVSRQTGAGWGVSKAMEGNVNTPENEGAQNISQDGQWLVFTGCNRREGYGSCDIFISFFTDKGWSEAMNMGKLINSEFWESQPCLSPDKQDLYFVSRRPGGLGGSDIYVSHLQPNGKWSNPENLGPSINTPGDEQCPFIHADNQTLYFTSNGWPGYGDADLYFVRKTGKNGWDKPVNLGYPINTISQEGTLFIAANGKTAYYASDRSDSKGGFDIYSFELREDIRPYRTLWVKGQVTDMKTKKGLPSTLELTDLASKQRLSNVQTDENGNYLVTLPVGKDYAFTVSRKGYLFYSDNFSLSKQAQDSVYEKNIPLQPIEANAHVILKNIFFDVNRFELRPESQVELDKLIQLLRDNPSVKMELSGHTDNAGKPADNLALSNNRAKAVVQYLVAAGIPVQRLVAKGYGETKPIADNKTEAGRALNRRTEMKIISQ